MYPSTRCSDTKWKKTKLYFHGSELFKCQQRAILVILFKYSKLLHTVLYLGYCIGRSDSSWMNDTMGTFPLSPEEASMLLTQKGCRGTEASETMDPSQETAQSCGEKKGKNIQKRNQWQVIFNKKLYLKILGFYYYTFVLSVATMCILFPSAYCEIHKYTL